MNDVIYWLWLQRAFGEGAKIGDIVAYFNSAKELYFAGEDAWRDSLLFGNTLLNPRPRRISNMLNVNLDSCKKTVEYCAKNKIGILTPDDPQYPKQLLTTNNYPAVLFYKGDPACLQSQLLISVIGTREPSDYGKIACQTITGDLVDNDAVIISGGALGIDSVAHKICVDKNKPTILVMGAGIDGGYLKQNEPLRQSIVEHGCIISEYLPTSHAKPGSFPIRNRIVASLSQAVAVFEAGAKSGTLNTCKHASKLGKPIFVLPGAIDSPLYYGSNMLLEEGAIPLVSAKSIFKFFDKSILSVSLLPARNVPFSGIDFINETDEFKYGISKTHRLQKLSQNQKNNIENQLNQNSSSSDMLASSHNSSQNDLDGFDENKTLKADYSSKLENLSENSRLVFSSMQKGFLTIDEIVKDTKLLAFKVLRSITELQLANLVDKDNSLKYKIL